MAYKVSYINDRMSRVLATFFISPIDTAPRSKGLQLVPQNSPLHHRDSHPQSKLLNLPIPRLLAQSAHRTQMLHLVDPQFGKDRCNME